MLKLRMPSQRPRQTPQEATRAALSKMSRRVDDLNIHQVQIPGFVLTFFPSPLGERKEKVGGSLSGGLSDCCLSFWSFYIDFKKRAVGKK